ncbi:MULTISPECIES: hypothetical protein [unclassified Sphingomonas]|uniref:hypothetical protein n=1 Tax=unclassified Sphingomonas TaxID=196159 RepID=UPI000BD90C23|nr:MAG: hypothetical protein B7Z43_05060 [Sphingomonas sp. 12-62-6]OYX39760.1 MAG: hypothetical protein B7Y98_03925 [Sphingomonas sp. 32-62-10]OYY65846.1 MAG: hypothetical protein B7Y49_04965 [Sphingomonas sp. 28-62-11]
MSVRNATIKTVSLAATAGLFATVFGASAAFAAVKAEGNTAAATEAPAPAPEKATAANDKRLYCVRSNPTGSRITREKCMTKAQWASRGFDVDNPEG